MTFFCLGWQLGFHRTGTCQWQAPGYESHGEPICTFPILKFKRKFLKFKILQRMHRKFPDLHQNHQNSILFHETIPLIPKVSYTQSWAQER
jgi:hypothetical protein